MAKRSIKDSMNSDAAFAFVKQGFDAPDKSNLVAMPTQEENTQKEKPVDKKSTNAKQTSPQKKREPTQKPRKQTASESVADHLVSVSTRMPSSLFADLKKEALTRQLNGQSPNSLQQILIDAADDWLRKNAKL